MFKVFLLLLIYSMPLLAERITIDPSSRSFEVRAPNKERIDIFDFSGIYPELQNIDINARRKKNVEVHLTGEYPILETIDYEGSFGYLHGELTGHFPKLSKINFLCTSCAMELDLSAHWQKSCEIQIRGADEDIALSLPKDIGLVIYTKTGLKGKVVAGEELKKQNRYGVLNKTFKNALAETSPIVLTIHIESADGRIILN